MMCSGLNFDKVILNTFSTIILGEDLSNVKAIVQNLADFEFIDVDQSI